MHRLYTIFQKAEPKTADAFLMPIRLKITYQNMSFFQYDQYKNRSLRSLQSCYFTTSIHEFRLRNRSKYRNYKFIKNDL
ncbi:MAG: hypothetical protein ACTSXL_01175 [Alphaproteobacteria bacterium]